MLVILEKQKNEYFTLVVVKGRVYLQDPDCNLYQVKIRLQRAHPSIKHEVKEIYHQAVAISELGELS